MKFDFMAYVSCYEYAKTRHAVVPVGHVMGM